ncbi:MAG: aspartate kinase [Thalassolituus maritimus]|jgi:aspartate kinase|uniref:aspartate kinase n=1 Tax=Thalassolituus maritimus TaxID=484498 RepID=A0A1N7K9G1_9GAMM|nr:MULTISPECIES: aspartate kinase [Thalassolituus]KZZ05224.1 aspartate kinase [Oleibacter sp. HI0075]TPD55991.1 MAG: aspartate kinase [Thalassolituus maritimus]SIS58228.1 aspartate kinase [Thalassolituus maritimus]|tara:strand:+ start:1145 stop:2599 length:1455 start_codon:yes stop_codon:yes gene_type:complete
MIKHSVEKIGGTSMSRYDDVLKNIWQRPQVPHGGTEKTLYQRAFVVSAYAGMTNGLLEHKKTGEPGVYALFSEMDENRPWQQKLYEVQAAMLAMNEEMFEGQDIVRRRADQFISSRIEDVKQCLEHLENVCTFGHFQLDDHLHRVREMLSALGEAHSAYNSVQLLKLNDINARFIDLTNWRSDSQQTLEDHISDAFADVDFTQEMPIVTGYTQCREGLMKTYDRGYSEMTFSKVATVTGAGEAIIHKEYHLSTADPEMVGAENVHPIGLTNYDVADQLANLGMEAIHPRAAAGLRKRNILLRVKNTFEPEHRGTEIRSDYSSKTPKVEIIAGTRSVWAMELFDQDMVGDPSYGQKMNDLVFESGVRVLTKDFNANTVTFYLKGNKRRINWLMDRLQANYTNADIRVEKMAMVSAIGSDMKVPGLLKSAASALSDAGVNILSVHQAMRQVDMMFIVADQDYAAAVKALHTDLIENNSDWEAVQSA